MVRVGLCTIAFKEKSAEEVLSIAAETQAETVEIWGQPPHVAYPIDPQALDALRARADALGIDIAAYGSYFGPGRSTDLDGVTPTAESELAATKHLGARLIRIWAGSKVPDETTPDERTAWIEEIRRFADTAADAHVQVVLERHGGSLTHGWEAPRRLLDEIDHQNVSLNYQAPSPAPLDEYASRAVDDYRSLLPLSRHAHIQNYIESPDGSLKRTLLDRGVIDYGHIGVACSESAFDGSLMIEFAADIRGGMSATEAIAADIAYLKSLVV